MAGAHEMGHGTVFKTKSLNHAFLYIFSCLGWWYQFDYAASHTYHHRYTLHPGDRENLLPIFPIVLPFLLVKLLTINLLTQPRRTFGKGGMISTIFHTVLGFLSVLVIPKSLISNGYQRYTKTNRINIRTPFGGTAL